MHAEHALHAMEGHHDHHAMAMPHGGATKKPPADHMPIMNGCVTAINCLIAARLITLLVAAVLLLAPMAPCAAHCAARCGRCRNGSAAHWARVGRRH